MVSLKRALTGKNIAAGWLYFYVHFVTEVICFYILGKETGNSAFLWLFPLVYDCLSFVPQSPIGYLSDKFKKLNSGLIGIILLALAGVCFWLKAFPSPYIPLVILCIGNCFTHIGGAEVTLRASEGRLSHSSIFVSGGSFGVITGRLLAGSFVPYWAIILLALSAIPFTLLAQMYKDEADKADNPCEKFNYANPKIPAGIIIVTATLIVIVRGYMGYGIPTSWNKTVFQTIMLFVTMGIGKAAGGIIADAFGVKKTALISAALALPFLMAGNEHMMISLIGVMLFSMTMSITLALLVSVLKKTPGLAFGFTTIGLFVGTMPIFFIKLTTVKSNCIVIAALTVLCLIAMEIIIRKDEKVND